MPDTSPLKERKGLDYFVPVPWETAIEIVADKLAGIIREHGGDAVAGLSSARCTNEENYLFQKFMRAGVGTNNVDHCARLCHASTVTGLGKAFGSGAMTNSINEIRDADCILITGSNTAESHPVISYEVVRAVNKGASLIVIDPRRTPMVEHAGLWLQPTPGTDIYIFLAMAHVIVREGWLDQTFIDARTTATTSSRPCCRGTHPRLRRCTAACRPRRSCLRLASMRWAWEPSISRGRHCDFGKRPPTGARGVIHPLCHGHYPTLQRYGPGAVPCQPGHAHRADRAAGDGRQPAAGPDPTCRAHAIWALCPMYCPATSR